MVLRYNFIMNTSVSYFRSFIFGVEDSLVSTVGLLSGIAIAGVQKETIFLTGIILIFVEAFSMAAGSFLSEYSAESYESGAEKPTKKNFISGIIMFFSYFGAGFIPLIPYIILPVEKGMAYSIGSSLGALFILGLIGAKISNTKIFKNSIRMMAIGGIAIGVGLIAGIFLTKI
jgi:VIT1/CCC1 family predicted Fe2+/Mn2+ transporter